MPYGQTITDRDEFETNSLTQPLFRITVLPQTGKNLRVEAVGDRSENKCVGLPVLKHHAPNETMPTELTL